MKNLNQIREYALQSMAAANNELREAPAADSVRIARLLDARDYHETVLAMCDRLDTSPVAVAVSYGGKTFFP